MFFQLQFFAALVVCSFGYHLDLDFMTTDDMDRYFSVRTAEEVPEYEIVSPTTFSTHGKRKRAIEIKDDTKEIKLTAFGEEFHMKLKENKQLIAEGLEVDQHNADGTVEKLPLQSRQCFYHGQLLSHNVSSVAVSTCKGLTGMIAMEKHNLYIHPLSDRHADEYRRKRRDIADPHIIYRRSVEDDMPDPESSNSSYCGLNPDYSDSHVISDAIKYTMSDPPTPVGESATTTTGPKYLEVRVMADLDMYLRYGENGVIPYTLTLMNIVAARFAEPTLDTSVIIHIVKLGVLKSDTYSENGADLTVSAEGVTTLENWSNFQYLTNQRGDTHPDHWDNAILISRKNLQENGQTGLLGIAWLGGTCYAPLQASYSEDAGLSSGQVIAHEIGHTLGMGHDGDQNSCRNRLNVMASSRLSDGVGSHAWSSCSRESFNTFLASPSKQCLNDIPQSVSQHTINAEDLPGATLDADKQCQLQSDTNTVFLGSCATRNLEDICNRLVCRRATDNACFSLVPAAEGTYCAPGKWCDAGKCVSKPVQNANNWAVSPGLCSVTCGNGVAEDVVRCISSTSNQAIDDSQCDSFTKPTPSRPQCTNPTTCPVAGVWVTFQAQCSVTCGLGTRDTIVSCRPTQTSSQILPDTACQQPKPPSQIQCNNGDCPVYGVWDITDFSDCTVTCGEGIRARTVSCRNSANYQQILPDSQCPGNKPHASEICHLPTCITGVWVSSSFSKCSVTCGHGTRTRSVSCRLSTNTQQVLPESQCLDKKPDTTLPCSQSECPLWAHSAFSACSVSCGAGTRSRTVSCISATYQVVADSQCAGIKPNTIEACNLENCPVSQSDHYWFQTSTFSQCNVNCGSGTKALVILCVDRISNSVADDTFCADTPRPDAVTQPCHLAPCPKSGTWKTTEFAGCSVTCGQGIKNRQVSCDSTRDGVALPESDCDLSTKPASQQPCNNGNCPNAPPPDNNDPDQGEQCAGLYTRPVTTLDRRSSTGGQFCKESIVAPVGQKIRLTFSRCNIRCVEGTDRGIVRDGNKLFRLCCYGGDDDEFTWTSSTHVIQLEHLTSVAGHGYQMTVEFVGNSGSQSGCDKILTSPTGTVTNPGYPSPYSYGLTCQTAIIAPPGMKVDLHFETLNLRVNFPWAPCFDNVEIYNLDEPATDGLRYCGKHYNPSALDQPPLDNRVLVQFMSGQNGYFNEGFVIHYQFIDA